ncbi:DUF3224 domain-containing protein [Actinocrispum sp. NPDC049592]|uniref:DUF3224 domain-containing protein n=1 Tax=Actinocrispum sp. NPDC049592 TaxID=3154835 RepID=UPI00344AFB6D
MKVTAKFEITAWENTAYEEPDEGPPLGTANITKTYTGAVEGTGTVRMLACQAGDKPEDGAGYMAQERVVGTLEGKKGSFVLHHGAVGDAENMNQYGYIIPGSATGELKGLKGTCVVNHGVLDLNYTL